MGDEVSSSGHCTDSLATFNKGGLCKCAWDWGTRICPDGPIVREMTASKKTWKFPAQAPVCENPEGNSGEVHVNSSPVNTGLRM